MVRVPDLGMPIEGIVLPHHLFLYPKIRTGVKLPFAHLFSMLPGWKDQS